MDSESKDNCEENVGAGAAQETPVVPPTQEANPVETSQPAGPTVPTAPEQSNIEVENTTAPIAAPQTAEAPGQPTSISRSTETRMCLSVPDWAVPALEANGAADLVTLIPVSADSIIPPRPVPKVTRKLTKEEEEAAEARKAYRRELMLKKAHLVKWHPFARAPEGVPISIIADAIKKGIPKPNVKKGGYITLRHKVIDFKKPGTRDHRQRQNDQYEYLKTLPEICARRCITDSIARTYPLRPCLVGLGPASSKRKLEADESEKQENEGQASPSKKLKSDEAPPE